MPFGDVLADFKEIGLETADGRNVKFKNNFLSRLGFKVIGIPHLHMRIRARKILGNMPKNKKVKILDAGCGFGIYSFTLKKKGYCVYPIDLDKKRIEFLKRNGIANASVVSLTKIKYPNNYFDVIICSDVLEHIKDDKKAFSELARVLKPEGKLLLTIPGDSKHNKKDYKRYRHERAGYSFSQIASFCKREKLNILRSSGYACPLTNLIFKLNEFLMSKNILLGISFYPLYFLSWFSEILSLGESDGLFFFLEKIKN